MSCTKRAMASWSRSRCFTASEVLELFYMGESGDEQEEYPSENDEKHENNTGLFDDVPEPHLQDQTWQNEAARSGSIAITSVLAKLDQDPNRDYDFTTESNHPSTPSSSSSSTQEDRDLSIMGTADSDNGDNPYDAETDVDLDLDPDEARKKN